MSRTVSADDRAQSIFAGESGWFAEVCSAFFGGQGACDARVGHGADVVDGSADLAVDEAHRAIPVCGEQACVVGAERDLLDDQDALLPEHLAQRGRGPGPRSDHNRGTAIAVSQCRYSS